MFLLVTFMLSILRARFTKAKVTAKIHGVLGLLSGQIHSKNLLGIASFHLNLRFDHFCVVIGIEIHDSHF